MPENYYRYGDEMSPQPLVGCWRLLSATLCNESGHVSYPVGPNAEGYLMYLAEGYMSWSMMRANSPDFASSDPLLGTDKEEIAAYESYFSYCGTYTIEKNLVVHQLAVSLFPNWTGSRQERLFDLSGNALVLKTRPMSIHGQTVTGYFTFERANPATYVGHA